MAECKLVSPEPLFNTIQETREGYRLLQIYELPAENIQPKMWW